MKTALLVCLLCGVASAHPLDMGYLKVETGESIAVSFDLDVVVAAQVLHVDAAKADAALIATQAGGIAAATYRMATPTVGGEPCTWGTAVAQLRGRNVTVDDTLKCPAGTVSWDMPLVKKMSTTFQVLARVRTGDQEQVVSLDKNSLTLEFGATSSAPSFSRAVWHGIVHGGVTPESWRHSGWPLGIDHLMLVVALLLMGGSLRRLVEIGGAFLAAHTIGIAIAYAIPLPATPFAVAFPVVGAVIAGAAVMGKLDARRWIAAAIAGVLHGLAVTSELDRSAASLLGFDLGLGIAQLAVILVFGPLASAAVRDATLRRYGVPAAGALVILISLEEIGRALSLF